jgi:hypothetical protein
MYIMYVDESGDTGMPFNPTSGQTTPSRYFVLSALVIHESYWLETLDWMVAFRRRMNKNYGLKMRHEIHASHFINKPGPLVVIPRNDRLSILRHFIEEMANHKHFNFFNIVVDKQGKNQSLDVFEFAWKVLIQRFETTLTHGHFNGSNNTSDWGMIFPDQTDVKRLKLLLRKLRRYNPIPSKVNGLSINLPIRLITEDPNFRSSDDSYFIQAADTVAYFLNQSLSPNAYIRKRGAHRYFSRLDPVLCDHVSNKGIKGVVML